jgi:hypothetical protein
VAHKTIDLPLSSEVHLPAGSLYFKIFVPSMECKHNGPFSKRRGRHTCGRAGSVVRIASVPGEAHSR